MSQKFLLNFSKKSVKMTPVQPSTASNVLRVRSAKTGATERLTVSGDARISAADLLRFCVEKSLLVGESFRIGANPANLSPVTDPQMLIPFTYKTCFYPLETATFFMWTRQGLQMHLQAFQMKMPSIRFSPPSPASVRGGIARLAGTAWVQDASTA